MRRRDSELRKRRWNDLLEIHGSNCVYCHEYPAEVIDHVIPWSYCFSNRIENLVPACSWCNLLVGARVYDSFDEKYEALIALRNKKQGGRKRRTTCGNCFVPYQYPLHGSNIVLCPECLDLDKGTSISDSKVWLQWLRLLEQAQMPIELYRKFRYMHKEGYSVERKRDMFGTIQADHISDLIEKNESQRAQLRSGRILKREQHPVEHVAVSELEKQLYDEHSYDKYEYCEKTYLSLESSSNCDSSVDFSTEVITEYKKLTTEELTEKAKIDIGIEIDAIYAKGSIGENLIHASGDMLREYSFACLIYAMAIGRDVDPFGSAEKMTSELVYEGWRWNKPKGAWGHGAELKKKAKTQKKTKKNLEAQRKKKLRAQKIKRQAAKREKKREAERKKRLEVKAKKKKSQDAKPKREKVILTVLSKRKG